MHFFTLDSSKIEVSATQFFDTLITENDHPRYVKHVLGRIHVLFTLLALGAGGGGGQTGLVHNLLMKFFSIYISKVRVFET